MAKAVLGDGDPRQLESAEAWMRRANHTWSLLAELVDASRIESGCLDLGRFINRCPRDEHQRTSC